MAQDLINLTPEQQQIFDKMAVALNNQQRLNLKGVKWKNFRCPKGVEQHPA